MGLLTFSGGIHPYEGKDLTKDSLSENIFQRESVFIRSVSI